MGALNIRCRIIIGTQNGTLILTTTHMTHTPLCGVDVIGGGEERCSKDDCEFLSAFLDRFGGQERWSKDDCDLLSAFLELLGWHCFVFYSLGFCVFLLMFVLSTQPHPNGLFRVVLNHCSSLKKYSMTPKGYLECCVCYGSNRVEM